MSKPGRLAARYLKSLIVGQGNPELAAAYADSTRWLDAAQVKAAVQGMALSGNAALAGPVGIDFHEYLRPRTILGKLTRVRRVPFKTRMVSMIGGTAAYWTKEGQAKAVSAGSFADLGSLEPRKLVGLSVHSQELARTSEAEDIILRDLGAATTEAMDRAFVDPAIAGDDETPRSITYGAASVAATSDPATDFRAAIALFSGQLSSASWLMHPVIAAGLALRGAPFDKLGVLGGELLQLPVITSEAVPLDSSGSIIVLVDENGLEVGDAEGARLSVSVEAAILMDDSPGMSSTTPTGSQMVSLYQTDSAATMADMFVNWRARPDAAVVISGASYA